VRSNEGAEGSHSKPFTLRSLAESLIRYLQHRVLTALWVFAQVFHCKTKTFSNLWWRKSRWGLRHAIAGAGNRADYNVLKRTGGVVVFKLFGKKTD